MSTLPGTKHVVLHLLPLTFYLSARAICIKCERKTASVKDKLKLVLYVNIAASFQGNSPNHRRDKTVGY